jgi:hypothetical protein
VEEIRYAGIELKKIDGPSPPFFSTRLKSTSLKMSTITSTMDFTVEMLKKLSELTARIEALQEMVRTNQGGKIPKTKAKKEKDPNAPPREVSAGVKAWQEFNSKVDALLKENSLTLQAGEGKQFTSSLKKLKGYEWADEDILEQRRAWVKPEKADKAEVIEVESVTSAVEAVAEATLTPKKSGRPKMTDDEKAAAKAKREAEPKKIGAAPGAPKKAAKNAWAEDDVIKELDAHLAE